MAKPNFVRRKTRIPQSAVFVKDAVLKIAPSVIKVRRAIHANPELGFQEKKTTCLIIKELTAANIPVRVTSEGVGAIGEIKGKYPGKTIVLRADIDALPIQEETGLSFSSKRSGLMHACGHDAHTAALIGAGRILAEYNRTVGLHGNVRLVFQPNEEARASDRSGAHLMIREGALKNASAVIGGHVFNNMRTGVQIQGKGGALQASANLFTITIRAPERHPGTALFNPLVAQGIIIGELSRKYRSSKDILVQPTEVAVQQRGSKGTLTPSEIKLVIRTGVLGSPKDEKKFIRGLNENIRYIVRRRILGAKTWKTKSEANRRVATEKELQGVSISVKTVRGNPPLYNDSGLAKLTRKATEDLGLKFGRSPTFKSAEDFALYGTVKSDGKRVPIHYMWTGANPKGTATPHHTPTFIINDEGTLNQAAVLAQSAIRFLNKK